MNQLIKAAKIVAAHGIRGQVKLKPLLNELPETLQTKEGKPFAFTQRGVSGDVIIADVPGITDRNAAEALKGTELYAEPEALPELQDGEYYTADLIGLEVREANKPVGRISSMHDYGAGDIAEITFADGRNEMYPFKHALFPEVNIAGGYVTFTPPEVTE